MARTKILLWHWGRRGGGPRITLELARALAPRDDVEVHLSLSRQSELFAETTSIGLPGYHVTTYRGAASAIVGGLRIPAYRRGLRAYLDAHDIRLVLCTMSHLWNVFVVPGLVCAARYVLIVHDAALHPGEENRLRARLMAAEIRRCDGVVALTEHVRHAVTQRYAYPAARTAIIPHGVLVFDSELAAARRYPVGRPFRVGFFGRILPYKGLPLLVEAMEILVRRHRGLELHVIGGGNIGDLVPRLQRLGAHIDNRWLPESEISAALARLDLLALPYIEASQSGVIAAACGAALPVVVTPVGGLLEQVHDRDSGIVAKSGTPEAIAAAIECLVTDAALYERCSSGARALAVGELSWPAIADRLLAFVVGGQTSSGVGNG